jgi:PAB1-binding protein PBP1
MSTCYQARVGSCGYVPSCHVPKAAASRGPGACNAYPLLETPGGVLIGGSGPIQGRGWQDRQIGGEIMFAHAYHRCLHKNLVARLRKTEVRR